MVPLGYNPSPVHFIPSQQEAICESEKLSCWQAGSWGGQKKAVSRKHFHFVKGPFLLTPIKEGEIFFDPAKSIVLLSSPCYQPIKGFLSEGPSFQK
jgi:hypothetical protein